MAVHDVAFGLLLLLAVSKDIVVFDYFRQAWDPGVTGVCIEKPFYTKWKGRLKLRGVELAGSQPGLSLYSELLQERYDVFKEHQPGPAKHI